MPQIAPVSHERLVGVFERDGFVYTRQRGDHLIYTKPGVKRPLVIPMYRVWTFAGLYANAALAARLRQRHSFAAAPNYLAVRLTGEQSSQEVETAVRELRAMPPESLLPEVSDKALEGLKFKACLPDALARRVLQTRMTDVSGVRQVLAEPVRFVMTAARL